MSAFICNETHIATCAEIVRTLGPAEVREMERGDIAAVLALENMKSVAFRYGPEGQEIYDRMMAPMIGQGFTVLRGGPAEEDPLSEMLPGGQTGREYAASCRLARPIVEYSPAEAHAWLSCLEYQSCEHPGWEGCEARAWIHAVQHGLALRIRDGLLGGREVRDIGGKPLHHGQVVLCREVHMATCASILEHCGLYVLMDRSYGDILEGLVEANLNALEAEGMGMAQSNRRRHRMRCRVAGPVDTSPLEAHALLSCVRDNCRADPGPEQTPVAEWLDDGLLSIAKEMRREALGGRHVWEAPELLDSPDAGEAPSP